MSIRRKVQRAVLEVERKERIAAEETRARNGVIQEGTDEVLGEVAHGQALYEEEENRVDPTDSCQKLDNILSTLTNHDGTIMLSRQS
ncbi:hypothetical protein L198_01308 [Cryptococcus wingfieldii CBS 7118]|uniref:Uncharacterized protein n=1 Tax=Cryptococcus wingfieldii CBS 7118 TaxID=1295528 RepID=A0A1E3JZ38_9TREE|nr:hypothetical protein L198_01308 [Cryptococcus wingfieldii CBS 7118]ODO06079.1 hypothetical protein L198_01308 [Cryptococcus wingfieldii CBS 7118]